jgi:hypothetical protein
MTIYQIKQKTLETSPYFFSRQTLKFFHQRMRDFSVNKVNGRYRISAPMRDHSGKQVGQTVRYFNPTNNQLEND